MKIGKSKPKKTAKTKTGKRPKRYETRGTTLNCPLANDFR
jgi:hypothetical protein